MFSALETTVKKLYKDVGKVEESNLQYKFPQSCDFCENKAHRKSSLEDHLKAHTYKELTYQCEVCDLLHGILSLGCSCMKGENIRGILSVPYVVLKQKVKII